MTMRLSLVVEGESEGAKKALKETAAALDETRNAAVTATGALGDVGAAAQSAGTQAAQGAASATAVAGTVATVAGAVGNEVAGLRQGFEGLAEIATGGASPLEYIIEKGVEISGLFGDGGPVARSLQSMTVSLLTAVGSPLQLAIAAVTIGAAAATYAFLQAGRDVEELLEDHEELLDRIADKYKEAKRGAYDYGRESAAALKVEARDTIAELEEALAAVLPGKLIASQGLGPFQSALDDWNRSLQDGTASARNVLAMVNEINANLRPIGVRMFGSKAESFRRAFEEAAKLEAALEKAKDAAKALSGDAEAAARAFGDARASELLSDLQFEREQLVRTSTEQEVYTNLKRAGVDASTAMGEAIAEETRELIALREAAEKAEELERDRVKAAERAAGVLGNLRHEHDLVHATNLEREVANQLKSAGVDITSDMGQAIADETQSLYEARAAQENYNATIGALGDVAYDAFDGLILQQEDWNDVLADGLNLLAKMLLKAALLGEGPLAGGLGLSGEGGAAGGLIGALFGGFRAEGGPVSAGQAYVIGERGPELFVPNVPGRVVSNSGAAGRDLTVNIPVNVNASGADSAAVTRLEGALASLRAQLPTLVVQAVGDAESRRMR